MKENFKMSENKHAESCCYVAGDNLLYALMNVTEDKQILISAYEVSLFDKYLDLAKEKDKDIHIDLDSCENIPYIIMYGGLMFHDIKWEHVRNYAENLKGYALINLEDEPYNLVASCYDDIIFFPDKAKRKNFIPFAALMKTKYNLKDYDFSITMFPCCRPLVWEDIANRPFLLACRESKLLPENVSIDNWKEYISHNILMEKYSVADLYTECKEEK